MKKIIIWGNQIGAKILYGYLKHDTRYEIISFCVDAEYIKENEFFDLPVLSYDNMIRDYSPDEYSIILGVGYKNLNKDRENIFTRVKDAGFYLETYIHPTATILNEYNIGEGTMIFAGSVIEPYTQIGKNSLIWANCVIAHDAVVEDNCWVAANSIVSGEARIKQNTFLGVNSIITNGVEVGEYSIIGAGALITKCTKPNEVYLSRISEKHRFDSFNYSKYFLG